MVICNKCGSSKAATDFYKNDRTCKVCRCAKVRANRADKIDYYRNYDNNCRSNPEERKAQREAYAKGKGKAVSSAVKKAWSERNSEQTKANTTTSNAIRDGKLVKKPCEVCGEQIAQAHHDDYNFPLVVRWLCVTHHVEWHKNNTPIRPKA